LFKDFTPPKGYTLLQVAPNYIIAEVISNLLLLEGLHPQILSSTFPYSDPIYMGSGFPVYVIIPEEEYEEAKNILESSNDI